MAGLVLDLQSDAMKPSVRVSDLLRKAKAVSTKLRTPEIEEWLERELKGYAKVADVPDYRRLHGQLRCYNPVQRRWMPLMFSGDPKIKDIYSTSPMTQPIGELEALVADGSGSLMRSFSAAQAQMLMSEMEYPMEPGMEIATSAVSAILDVVRTRVLDWALDLERNDVLGENLSFSPEERVAASHVTHNHFTTNIGSMSGSQVQQGTVESTQTIATGIDAQALAALVDSIAGQVAEMQLSDTQRAELVGELDTLRAQAASPRPKSAFIRESLATVRHILEASAAHALVSHYGPQIAALIAQIRV